MWPLELWTREIIVGGVDNKNQGSILMQLSACIHYLLAGRWHAFNHNSAENIKNWKGTLKVSEAALPRAFHGPRKDAHTTFKNVKEKLPCEYSVGFLAGHSHSAVKCLTLWNKTQQLSDEVIIGFQHPIWRVK